MRCVFPTFSNINSAKFSENTEEGVGENNSQGRFNGLILALSREGKMVVQILANMFTPKETHFSFNGVMDD
jgi:hypothetical protein